MGRKKRSDPDAITHLAHDVLILHLFELFNRIEQQRERGLARRKSFESAALAAIDPRTLERAKKGHGISPGSAQKIADALSRKLAQLIEHSGGSEKLLNEMRQSLEWSDPARAFQWLEDRIAGKPPYIHEGDIIINRNDRHLIDDYHVTLAVAPTPGRVTTIEYPDRPAQAFSHDTVALVTYAVTFSPHNRNYQADFTLRSITDGKLELIEPAVENLKEPALYRRHRTHAVFTPDPRNRTPQRFSVLVYGGYDRGQEHVHFSLMQVALYRHVRLTLDLSAYPEDAIEGVRLFVVCKLPGRDFDCCSANAAREGQTIKPESQAGGRYQWHFLSFENMMLGVHWTIDYERIRPVPSRSREDVLAQLSGAGSVITSTEAARS